MDDNRFQRDRFEEEWEREERKEKFTFMILGLLIVVLLIVIVGGFSHLIREQREKFDMKDVMASEDGLYREFAMDNDFANVEREEAQHNTAAGSQEEIMQSSPNVSITPEVLQPSAGLNSSGETSDPTESDRETDKNSVVDASEYIIYDSDVRYVTAADLKNLSAWEVRLARNEIYARHGRMFDDKSLREYFESKSWYKPTIPAAQFNLFSLSTLEQENLNFIVSYEKAHGLN